METAQKVFSDFHELEKSLESLRVFVQSMQIYVPASYLIKVPLLRLRLYEASSRLIPTAFLASFNMVT